MLDYILYWFLGIGQDFSFSVAPAIIAAWIAAGASAASTIGSTAYNSVQNNRLSRGQKQMNAFNASEAAKQREFEEHMHDRQLEESNTAFQRQTKDMLAAGVNPALLYGSGAGSGAPVASIGSGGAAASGSYSPQSIADPDLGTKLMDIQVKRAQVQNIDADTKYKQSQTRGVDIDNSNKPAYWDAYLESLRKSNQLTDAQISKVEQETRTEEFRTEVEKNNVKVSEAQACISGFEKIMRAIDAEAHQTLVNLGIEAQRLANAGAEAELRKKEAEIGLLYASTAVQLAQKGVLTEQEKSIFISNEIASATKEHSISIVRNQADIARNQRVISGNEAYWSNTGVKYGILGRALTGSTGSASLSGALAGAAVKFLSFTP